MIIVVAFALMTTTAAVRPATALLKLEKKNYFKYEL